MNALTHGLPDATTASTSIGLETEDPEVGRVVYHGLDPQHAPLVVELEAVLADAMLDTAPLGTSGMTSFELCGLGPLPQTQESHHVISRECTPGVVEQVVEHFEQARTIAPPAFVARASARAITFELACFTNRPNSLAM